MSNISDKSLTELYSLAFSKITGALINDYRKRFGGTIHLVIKHKIFIILRNGKYFETVRMDRIDSLFQTIDVSTLRKNLKEM